MSRRARLTPERAGVPTGMNRRVTGLRRAEVALLADISVEYYAKPERGAIAGASSSVLDAVANAFQMDEAEQAHLMDLARAADGIPTSGRPGRRTAASPATRPSLHWALEAITGAAAIVRNAQLDVVAVNALARAFCSPVIGDAGRTPNLDRFQFLDPHPGTSTPTGTCSRRCGWPSCARRRDAIRTTRGVKVSWVSCPLEATPSGSSGERTTSAPTVPERSASTIPSSGS